MFFRIDESITEKRMAILFCNYGNQIHVKMCSFADVALRACVNIRHVYDVEM